MDKQTAFEIGVEGYVFLYPLVLMEVTRAQATNVAHPGDMPMRAPVDTFVHAVAFPRADFTDVVRPNFDTLYSIAWLDVHDEPRIITAGDAGDNYYLLPLYDMWGEVFACPGVRTTGRKARAFAICPPGWKGDLPAGVRRYDAPTPTVWIVGRTEASPETYDKVHAFQAGLTATPLSAWGDDQPVPVGTPDPSIDGETPPLRTVFGMDAPTFFGHAAELMKIHRPHALDYPVLDRLAQIGMVVGESFDMGALGSDVRAGLIEAVPAAQQKITAFQRHMGRQVNGWLINDTVMGNYGSWYLKRATVELIGLGANLPEDALYPLVYVDADGAPLNGSNRYVWHMAPDEIPPVNGFWSLTLYDDEGFQAANRLDRFAIGDRDTMEFNADGSLDIFIQHNEPEQGTSNWLPAPEGSFNLVARLYWPKPEALEGVWVPQPIRRVG